MAIEGLKNIYIIPVIKKDREADTNQRKKQNRESKKERKKEDDQDKNKEGKVNIRI